RTVPTSSRPLSLHDALPIYLRRYCQKHQLALLVKHWPRATHPQTGIEAAARRFRYQFFAEVMAARQSPILLTAHHQNDLAETMLDRKSTRLNSSHVSISYAV